MRPGFLMGLFCALCLLLVACAAISLAASQSSCQWLGFATVYTPPQILECAIYNPVLPHKVQWKVQLLTLGHQNYFNIFFFSLMHTAFPNKAMKKDFFSAGHRKVFITFLQSGTSAILTVLIILLYMYNGCGL